MYVKCRKQNEPQDQIDRFIQISETINIIKMTQNKSPNETKEPQQPTSQTANNQVHHRRRRLKKNHAQDRKQGNPVKLRFFRPPKFKDDTNNQESDLETNPRIVDRNWGSLH